MRGNTLTSVAMIIGDKMKTKLQSVFVMFAVAVIVFLKH
jgi:hypothetical protein